MPCDFCVLEIDLNNKKRQNENIFEIYSKTYFQQQKVVKNKKKKRKKNHTFVVLIFNIIIIHSFYVLTKRLIYV